jgi:hypothetical protein
VHTVRSNASPFAMEKMKGLAALLADSVGRVEYPKRLKNSVKWVLDVHNVFGRCAASSCTARDSVYGFPKRGVVQ